MIRPTVPPSILVPAICVLTACASGAFPGPPPPESQRAGDARVIVENAGWREAIVYVIMDGYRDPVRLGSVQALANGRMPLGLARPRTVEFELRELGTGARYRTAPIQVLPGDLLKLRIPGHLRLSVVSRISAGS